MEWPNVDQCLAKSHSIPLDRHRLEQALHLKNPSSAIQNRHHLLILVIHSPVFPLHRRKILCLEKQLFFAPAWRFVTLFSRDIKERILQVWKQDSAYMVGHVMSEEILRHFMSNMKNGYVNIKSATNINLLKDSQAGISRQNKRK